MMIKIAFAIAVYIVFMVLLFGIGAPWVINSLPSGSGFLVLIFLGVLALWVAVLLFKKPLRKIRDKRNKKEEL